MSDNIIPLFGQPFAPEKAEPIKRPYQAYTLSDPAKRRWETRLLLDFQQGTRMLVSYASLTEIIFTYENFLGLVFPYYSITLFGYNLTELIEPLQEQRVRSVQAYVSNLFFKPDDPGAVLIVGMERKRH